MVLHRTSSGSIGGFTFSVIRIFVGNGQNTNERQAILKARYCHLIIVAVPLFYCFNNRIIHARTSARPIEFSSTSDTSRLIAINLIYIKERKKKETFSLLRGTSDISRSLLRVENSKKFRTERVGEKQTTRSCLYIHARVYSICS